MACRKNQEVIEVLEDALEKAKDNSKATEVVIFMKIGDEYYRTSSGLNSMQFIAFLELAKYDILRQMAIVEDAPDSFIFVN